MRTKFPASAIAGCKSIAYLTFAPGQVSLSVFAPDGHPLNFKPGWEQSLASIGAIRSSGSDASGECVVIASKSADVDSAVSEVSMPGLATVLAGAGVPTPVFINSNPGDLPLIVFSGPTGTQNYDQAFGLLVSPNSPPASVTGTARGTGGSFAVICLFAFVLLSPWSAALRTGRKKPTLDPEDVQKKYDRSRGYTVRLYATIASATLLSVLTDFYHINETWLLSTHGLSPWPIVLVVVGSYPLALTLAVHRARRVPGETRSSREIGRQFLQTSGRVALILEFAAGMVGLLSFTLQAADGTSLFLVILAGVIPVTLAIYLLSRSKPARLADFCPGLAELTTRAGITVKSAHVIESSRTSAYAVSRHQLVVTRPCIELLTPDELEAVVAHELGHIKFKDAERRAKIRGVIVVAGSATGVGLATAAGWDASNPGLLAALGFLVIGIVRPLVMNARSRREEFRADRFAADLVSAPALAAALQKLYAANQVATRLNRIDKATMAHPALQDRIAALEPQPMAA